MLETLVFRGKITFHSRSKGRSRLLKNTTALVNFEDSLITKDIFSYLVLAMPLYNDDVDYLN